MSSVFLSVIVPVHGVQGYLRQCLDSILYPGCPDLEVIAIDDKSPDGCGAILDEYALRDPRLRVVHLEQNVGLGEARNVGLSLATGEYVWFFDSDDYAADGAMSSVYDRLHETRPDVLIFDYARSYWHGKVQRSVINKLFREPPAPEVFALKDRASVLQLMMTAWNKAIRRDFLVDLGIKFSGGYYEDINVTYPILMAADKLSLLDEVVYIYRQRRRGAITRTGGKKHFDAFAQYERIFAFMDRHPETDQYRPLMFDRTIWHLLIILGRGDRVLPEDRAKFFAGMSKIYKTYRPKAHVLPEDAQLAAKYKLIEKNNYRAFATSKRLNEQRLAAKQRLRKTKRQARRAINFAKGKAKGVYYRIQLRMPLDPNLAVYAAYWYRGYACNPAAIYEKQKELAPQIKGVWVVRKGSHKEMPEGVPYVVAGSRAHSRLMARAKYFVNNVNFTDDPVKRKGQVHVMTQHGTPLKKMGLDQMDFPVSAGDMDFRELIMRADRWDYLVSSNLLSSEAWDRGFPCSYEMLEVGYPRNDRLVRATEAERTRLRAELGIKPGVKAILYTPTHRDYMKRFAPQFDLVEFAKTLGPDYVLLLRAHYFYKPKKRGLPEDRIIDVSGYPTVEDLMIASDALITDYSSIMFDYAVLEDRPIVIYANDWDTYKRTRGVNFDLSQQPPGVFAQTPEELTDAFLTGAAWGGSAAKDRVEFRARYCPWDNGSAAERVVRRVYLGQQLPKPVR
ncbi:CDP-glycerol glycerophosphotransferase [Actinocorallia herbida]|uniref:CDP-glycerol glycerophosphotransferase n=1 Tax=Actinocorallia herbida TaxID=58109 RepID=A0A3N1D925_9ACTN|nr:CDP-glycerol glycerophosphotransferase [Actinocorallia herbida]